jgi:FtsP/CotA-like multicopper oxidase with cupredoxin domain
VSRSQRLTFLGIAALIAVVAIVVLLVAGGGSDDEQEAAATPTATAAPGADATETPTPTPTATATPKPQPPLLRAGKVTEIEVKEGQTVRFRVTSDEDEEIHVHGYDIEEEIPAGETINVSFPATITGIFEIEFHHSEEQIGSLRVDPD